MFSNSAEIQTINQKIQNVPAIQILCLSISYVFLRVKKQNKNTVLFFILHFQLNEVTGFCDNTTYLSYLPNCQTH